MEGTEVASVPVAAQRRKPTVNQSIAGRSTLRHPPQWERGATLIEAVLFTVIALGLITGGVVFFEQASISAQTNSTIRLIASLQSQVRSLHQSQADFGTADMTTLLITTNAVPSSLQRDTDSDGTADTIVNNMGGKVTVTGATSRFTFKAEDIPVGICSRIVPFNDLGYGPAGTGIVSVSDGTDTDSDGLNPAEAAAFCTKNATDGAVDLIWTFDR